MRYCNGVFLNKQYPFIALTANENTWECNQEQIVFLGEWCKKWSRKHIWEKTSHETLPYLWDDASKIEKAIEYTDEVYKHILELLTQKLNNIHNTTHESKFWNIILGDWIISYTHIMYDRYLNIERLVKQYGFFECYGLKKQHHIICCDSSDFVQKSATDDLFNLQIFSDILDFFLIPYKEVYLTQTQKKVLEYNKDRSFFKRITDSIKRNIGSQVIFCQVYQEEKFLKWLWKLFKHKGVVSNDDMLYPATIKIKKIDHTMRKQQKPSCQTDDRFLKFAIEHIFDYIPLLYLEGFSSFVSIVDRLPIKKASCIISANAAYTNYFYKFFLANNYKQIKSYYVQHGGCYGLDKKMVSEKYEKSISHLYWTWGWKKANEEPCCPQKAMSLYDATQQQCDYEIFLTLDIMYLYFTMFHYFLQSGAFRDIYIRRVFNFLSTIQSKNILARPHKIDCEQGLLDRLKDQNNIVISNHSKTFLQELHTSKIAVFPHLLTTQWESLVANHPTIIIATKNELHWGNEWKELEDKLIFEKVLFLDPKEAAHHCNHLLNNNLVDDWWNSPGIRSLISLIKKKYIIPQEDWLKMWIKKYMENKYAS